MPNWRFMNLFGRGAGNLPEDSIESAGEDCGEPDPIVVGRKRLLPDPNMMQAIGRNHSFESAVADIVDNSLDAGASNVLIRFVRNRGELAGLYIVDDGKGMDATTIDRAMTFGGRREYSESDLGHFGVGLKAASLGQAQTLTVVSRTRQSLAVGRRLSAERVATEFECEVLSTTYAAEILDRTWGTLSLNSGTAVVWGDLRAIPAIGSIDALLQALTSDLNRHLGLVFHRLISRRGVNITIDQEDVGHEATGAPLRVTPIDPFGYQKSGRLDYPRTLRASSESGELELHCHIWPGRSNDANFRLTTSAPAGTQGLYIYRNDRLLQCGGWHGIAIAKDELQLARVAVDVNGGNWFALNPEKTQVEPSATFKTIARNARDQQVDLLKYLDDATHTYRESRKRTRKRPKVLAPGSGVAPSVKAAISAEYEFIHGRDPLEIRWADLDADQFFEVDKDAGLIRLNRSFRSALLGERAASLNDAPLVKALIYLLAEPVMRGEILGPRDKDNLSIWQAVLAAAAKAEIK